MVECFNPGQSCGHPAVTTRDTLRVTPNEEVVPRAIRLAYAAFYTGVNAVYSIPDGVVGTGVPAVIVLQGTKLTAVLAFDVKSLDLD